MTTSQAARVATADPMWVHPSLESFDALVARIEALLSHGRRMTLIERFINPAGPDSLEISRDLVVDESEGPGVEVRSSTGQEGERRSFVLHLSPGLHRVSFTATARRAEVTARLWEARGAAGQDWLTQVRLEGLGATPTAYDTLEVEHWNEHGVGRIQTLIFHR